MNTDFQRLAIVNRGEPAMRAIHAARELSREVGRKAPALTTIAFYTEPDTRSMFVREADEAFLLGPATFVDPHDGERKSAYLDYDRLRQVLREAQVEAVWVGWGFVAEHARFVDLCDELGIVFVGPSAEVMRRLGDKISSKRLAEEARVPVAPWSGGPVETLDEARDHAERLGYPLMIKATAGGGGRGIRKVHSESELRSAFERARSEALKAFGDGTVFLERLLAGARHVEVQLIADRHGTAWGLGVRDCTIQRRNQKVLEESPSPALTEEQDTELRAAAVRLAQRVGYHNAGTVEFLYDETSCAFSFMEVNARLQVEHPVTEMTTGTDLVKLQIHVARGGRLEGEAPAARGAAIEVRLNAEDPENAFAPAPGRIDLFRLPTGPGLRIDTGVEAGDSVPAEFDSMIAKIIAWGNDRAEALARLRRALADAAVVVHGGTTNKGFLLDLLHREEVTTGAVDVGWLDRQVVAGEHLSHDNAEIALIEAAICVYTSEVAIEQARFLVSASGGRPEVSGEIARQVELEIYGQRYKLGVYRLGQQRFRLEIDGSWIDVERELLGHFERWLTVAGRRYRVLSVDHGAAFLVEVDGVPHRVSRDEGGVVRAPSPAVVVSVAVAAGDEVMEGDRLAVLEAMKMETAVVARFNGTVREVLVAAGVQVATGGALLRIEPQAAGAEGDRPRAAGARLEFDHLQPATAEDSTPPECRQIFEELRCLIKGYDVGSGHLRYLMEGRGTLCEKLPADHAELLATEEQLLTLFVDLCSLFDRQPDHDGLEDAGRLSASAYLRAYLRDLDAAGEGLPETFLKKLRRALAHYRVEELERTPELVESLWRIYRSQRRVEEQVAPILSVLERRLEHLELLADGAGETFRALLDRLVAETRNRFPAIHDCAREVRYRFFDRTAWQEARGNVYAEAAEDLRALESGEGGPERMDSLVQCPQPLKSYISSRFGVASEAMQQAMLEVLTRRYYRLRKLENVRVFHTGGRAFCAAEYEHRWKRFHLLTTHAEYRDLGAAFQALTPLAQACPPHDDVVLDVYVWRTETEGNSTTVRDHVLELLEATDFGRAVIQVEVAISSPQGGLGMSGVQHLTFRGTDAQSSGKWSQEELRAAGFVEEKLYGSLHPMMGRRLLIWRLAHFEIERLHPTEEDVYVFRGVARKNPRDERIFALAEVRDLTPVRDAGGRVVEMPHLERMYLAALSGIRRFQSQRAPRQRLHWNRVLLYLWPTLELRPDEIHDLANRLAPEAEGLGIEKVVARARLAPSGSGVVSLDGPEEPRETELHIWHRTGQGSVVRFRDPSDQPIKPLTRYAQKVVRLRRRGLHDPYEVVARLAPERGASADFPPGDFQEYDLDDGGALVPVDRPPGGNRANVVFGLIRNFTTKVPEGMTRVILLGDPGHSMGSLAEAECSRILAAIDLARERQVPLEWFAVSAGAKIAMDSGTENMDWIARVLRRLVVFTQDGGEVNIIVPGINVGAQPYWNAEATMLMHTRGILIMTPEGAMVLTGKQALDYSGGVSAEDNQGIGGYEHIMGPNGQAQYYARDLGEACSILLRYYDHSYVVPGERFPRRAATTDEPSRDVSDSPHGRRDGTSFHRVGEVFSPDRNPGRKNPFDVRRVMAAVIDRDLEPLERWFGMRDAEIGVVWDAHLGGYPVCLLGLESRPLSRLGFIPADGPAQWTSGTLFPQSSKKIARAINAASGSRPVVILANLSGFDGSPESMRSWQLEYGAEIGRAVVNFDGPMIFCVISRYHGGAFVVFSGALNENLEVAALEGSFASVIGGAPAAAVVFARDVRRRTHEDPRVAEIEHAIPGADGAEKVRLQAQLQEVFKAVHSEKLGEVAEDFDRVHSIHRAQKVGSVQHIIAPSKLRSYLIDAVKRGMLRVLEARTEPTAVDAPAAADAPA